MIGSYHARSSFFLLINLQHNVGVLSHWLLLIGIDQVSVSLELFRGSKSAQNGLKHQNMNMNNAFFDKTQFLGHITACWNKANSHKSCALSTINVFSDFTLKLYPQTLLSNCTLTVLSNCTLKLYSQTVLSDCTLKLYPRTLETVMCTSFKKSYKIKNLADINCGWISWKMWKTLKTTNNNKQRKTKIKRIKKKVKNIIKTQKSSKNCLKTAQKSIKKYIKMKWLQTDRPT